MQIGLIYIYIYIYISIQKNKNNIRPICTWDMSYDINFACPLLLQKNKNKKTFACSFSKA